jgi:hypothetical protein
LVIVYDGHVMNTENYFIAEGALAEFERRMKPIVRRATRCNAPISYVINRDIFEDRKLKLLNTEGKEVERIVRYYRVEVAGEKPKFAGWKFVGTLEHTTEGNLLRLLPNETCPEHFRTLAPYSDHSQVTYIVAHENGDFKQVGSGCIKDFLGAASPQTIAKMAENWISFQDLLEVTKGVGLGGAFYTNVERWDIMQFLSKVCAIVRVDDGRFVSRASVNRMIEKYGESCRVPEVTGQKAFDMQWPGNHTLLYRKEDILKYATLPEDEKMAEKAIEWAMSEFGGGLSDTDVDAIQASILGTQQGRQLNDFEHNLYVIAKGQSIERRTMGIAAYLIQAYRKAHNLVPEYKPKQRLTSNHIGTIKERLRGVEVTLEKRFTWNSEEFGEGVRFKMITKEGNVLVWKTYNVADEKDMVEGRGYVITGTVSKHDEYHGEKQTVLQRLSVDLGIVPQQPENLEPDDTQIAA